MCWQEEAAAFFTPLLSRNIIGSHSTLFVASFLARFLRPRAFFPLGIDTMLCRVADQRQHVDIAARNSTYFEGKLTNLVIIANSQDLESLSLEKMKRRTAEDPVNRAREEEAREDRRPC